SPVKSIRPIGRAQVGGKALRLASQRTDLLSRLIGRAPVAVACHRRTGLSQGESNGASQPTGRSSDQGQLSIQTKLIEDSHLLVPYDVFRTSQRCREGNANNTRSRHPFCPGRKAVPLF